jgi:homogentisate 1,2-dioxygenase
MPYYLQRGSVPSKRHTQHYGPEGKLCYEEHIGRVGFSDLYSNLYHIHPPTRILGVGEFRPVSFSSIEDRTQRLCLLETFRLASRGDWISGRNYLLFNQDVALATISPSEKGDFFYRNGYCDEIVFVHQGQGKLNSIFGSLDFGPGDYIVIPRGTLYQLGYEDKDNRMLIIESRGQVTTPSRYRNPQGQHLEQAPFCERDFRTPRFLESMDEKGEFKIHVKLEKGVQSYILGHHPFDVVGWDGFFYPWIFNIKDFMPIVGKVHRPPPVHQTFEAPGFVVCSLVPRLLDFHEKSIPAPYAHSNVDMDEVVYQVEGESIMRKGVGPGSLTFHPAGVTHGPQPDRYEGSIGKKDTQGYGIMIDTFSPLTMTQVSKDIEDPGYALSFA